MAVSSTVDDRTGGAGGGGVDDTAGIVAWLGTAYANGEGQGFRFARAAAAEQGAHAGEQFGKGKGFDEVIVGAQLQPTHAVFDLIATVGFYSVLGYILMTYDTPIDAAVAREVAERPLDDGGR